MAKSGGGGGRKGYVSGEKAGKIGGFLDEVDKIERSASGNSRNGIFARRAHQAVANAYEAEFDSKYKRTGRYKPRSGVDTTTADKLVAMGATEAVYGRGRQLLH